jgi:N utilization substance protein B
MSNPDVAALARELLAAAPSGEALADLARGHADAAGTRLLRGAVDLLREAARGETAEVPAPDAGALFLIARLVRRDEVLAALYEADRRSAPPDTEGLDEVGAALARGVWEARQDLDAALGAVSEDWRVDRMPVVDRTVLRLALWELRHRREVPPGVVISEAVRLAKAYSTERSGAFVNGVLGRLAREAPAD